MKLLRTAITIHIMESEVAILVTVRPAYGKSKRVSLRFPGYSKTFNSNFRQLKDLLGCAVEWIQTNEPGTLDFLMYESQSEDGTVLSIFERFVG